MEQKPLQQHPLAIELIINFLSFNYSFLIQISGPATHVETVQDFLGAARPMSGLS